MTTLFHYTDINGFFNIIKHKKLWLSGPHNLNDHQEVHWAYHKIKSTLNKLTSDYNHDHIEFIWNQTNLMKLVPFSCSLSSDGDLLSQWRAYAKDGSGVAIGFNSELLPKTGSLPHHSAMLKNSITTLKVEYDNEVQDGVIDQILRTTLDAMKGKETEELGNIVIEVAYKLNGFATIFKNNAFKEECEWRIIHTPMIMGNTKTNKTTSNGISELCHRVSNEKLISYFEYDFSELVSQGLITHLVLGPKCAIEAYDLELFLTTSGLERLVFSRSRASYR
ncbi:DUF2971 domain-containing protein [Pseudomonas frederiksbergensis]|nr:DUF2971 domain-containing protein [Pseudomonas frederiksbergensis]